MKYSRRWDIKFRVNKKETALQEFNKIEKALSGNVTLVSCEKYWKKPELFTCIFEEIIDDKQPAQIVYETLLEAGKIMSHWHVTGPTEHGDGSFEFDGVYSRENSHSTLSSIEWAHFDVFKVTP